MLKISFCCPVKNKGLYIGDMIESVLHQTSNHWELVIVDDNSKDQTKDILKYYEDKDKRIRVVYLEESVGADDCRNLARTHARSDLIAVIDGDDRCDAPRAKITIEHFEKYPDTDLFYGTHCLMTEQGDRGYLQIAESINDDIVKEAGIFGFCHSTVAYPKKIAEQYPYIKGKGEWYLYWQLFNDKKIFRYTRKLLSHYRCSERNLEDVVKREQLIFKKRKIMADESKSKFCNASISG